MRPIRVQDLRPGMTFDKPVYIEGENVLVPAQVPIKDKDIERLTRWDIEEVYTDGSPVRTAGEAPAAARAKGGLAWLPAAGEKLARTYRAAVEKVDLVFQDITDGTYLHHEPIDALVGDLLEVVRNNRNEFIQLILLGERVERKLSASAVNCLVVAAVIGQSMKLAGHRLVQLATGALLHDVGMLKVDRELLNRDSRLSAEEINRVRTHTVTGYQVISRDMRYPEDIAVAALQHHEHWDGRGYPRHLRGEDIHLFGRIVGVADTYEAMVSERPYRNATIAYSAMKSILSDNGKRFDPQVLKAFLESMGVFPIGSIVQLNDSSIGRVTANHPQAPLRPR
ncbi:MAG: HD-GYP domain-containing protein, partial [Spirochaetales bacterium]|nr:HD-GYP domain-containing protein [Spirochaetales bacterium]